MNEPGSKDVDFRRILRARLEECAPKLLKELATDDESVLDRVNAALEFLILAKVSAQAKPSRDRIAVQEVRESAARLEMALRELPFSAEARLEATRPNELSIQNLLEVAKGSEFIKTLWDLQALPLIPVAPGAPKNWGMYRATLMLAKLWMEVTGNPPGLPASSSYSDTQRGRFWRFLALCFEALPPEYEQRPSEHQVRKVCQLLRKQG